MMKTTQSIVEIAEETLRDAQHPLHYTQISARILQKRKLSGKTPDQTIRSRLAISPKFKRVAEGVYALAEWTEYPIARFAKDIAYDVLKSHGEPMPLMELGESVLRERQFTSRPNQVARNVLQVDSRFYYDPQTRLISLAEWHPER